MNQFSHISHAVKSKKPSLPYKQCLNQTNNKELKLEEIIILCAKGKGKGQQALYTIYNTKMYGVCLRYFKSKEEAQDALHDGFVKLFSKIKHYVFSNNQSFEGWMRRLFVNICLDQLKAQQRLKFKEIKDGEAVAVEYEISDDLSSVSINELLSLINKLPIGYQTIFNMHCIEGYSHKEIAELLNITVSTSTTQLMRAKKVLQEQLKKITHEIN